jgi:hypothetical protein
LNLSLCQAREEPGSESTVTDALSSFFPRGMSVTTLSDPGRSADAM